jgi:hypothetical protein
VQLSVGRIVWIKSLVARLFRTSQRTPRARREPSATLSRLECYSGVSCGVSQRRLPLRFVDRTRRPARNSESLHSGDQ